MEIFPSSDFNSKINVPGPALNRSAKSMIEDEIARRSSNHQIRNTQPACNCIDVAVNLDDALRQLINNQDICHTVALQFQYSADLSTQLVQHKLTVDVHSRHHLKVAL